MSNTGTVRRGLLCAAAAVLLLAHFETRAQPAVVLSEPIEEAPLADALNSLSRQTGLQIVYLSKVADGLRAGGIPAGLEPQEALRRLLDSTGLEFKFLNDRTVTVFAAGTRPAHEPDIMGDVQSAPGESAERRRLASASPQQDVTGNERERNAADESESRGAVRPPDTRLSGDRPQLGEVVVVGSRLATEKETAQVVKVVTRDDINRRGATSVPQVLNMLSEVSFNSTGSSTQGRTGVTTVRMRGLPTGTTLVLINGRRAGFSGGQSDSGIINLASVPISAVERIEVLPSGSSAVHGGDALAGVVNIVLKKDVQGFGADLQYGSADSYFETRSSVAWGHSWERGSLTFVGTYETQDELQGRDRDITSSSDHRPYGGPDRRVAMANPGNVRSVDGQNLPGLSSPFAAVPDGSTGVGLTPADFQATAGTRNLSSHLAWSDDVAPERRYGAILYGTFEVTDAVELYTELFYSHTWREQGIFFPLLSGLRVPASNPYNPFGVDVLVDYQMIGGSRLLATSETDYALPLLGVRGDLGGWQWDVAAWMSKDREHSPSSRVDAAVLAASLASTDPALSLNVFRDGPGGSPELLDSIISATSTLDYEGQLEAASASIRGTLPGLPAGDLQVLFGTEYEASSLEYLDSPESRLAFPTAGFSASRDSYALFSEARVPLVRSAGDREVLTLSGAVRYDHYEGFGGRASPGAGLELRPMDSLLLLRATYGSSFKPPTIFTLNSRQSSSVVTIMDPMRGDEVYVTPYTHAGNPDLEPQTGRSRTIGALFSPRAVPGLDLSLTYWTVRVDSGFTTPSSQFVVDNEDRYPGRVVRDASGRIILISRNYLNFGYMDVAGYDLTADWRFSSAAGEFTTALSATKTTRFESQIIPGTPPRNVVGVAQAAPGGYAPEWKGTFSLGWEYGPWQTTFSGRYVNEYRDVGPLADGSFKMLGDVWHFDASARLDLSRFLQPRINALQGAQLGLGVRNVFDQLPEFANFRTGWNYDPSQYDIFGRLIYGQVRFSF